MSYLIWSLPSLVVAGAIGSGRFNTTRAAALGLALAIPIALLAGALPYGAPELLQSVARGAWIGATIAPYIFGGLLFWLLASRRSAISHAVDPAPAGAWELLHQRRLLFCACFLVGPFAESATGSGVGMLATVAVLRPLRIAPRHLLVFALLSQTMIPWGGMGNGTLLAATYARIPGELLALHAVPPTAVLMALWLLLFWRTAGAAGFDAPWPERLREIAWIGAGLGLLTLTIVFLGPEISHLAAFGPLIVLRYLADVRPGWAAWVAMARRTLPYTALVALLVTTRMQPELRAALLAWWRVAPFADLPAWSPLFHAGSWLAAAGLLSAIARGQAARLPSALREAWHTGRHAMASVVLFALMAEIMTASGIAQAIADGMFDGFGHHAVKLAALVSSSLGMLTNSGAMPNSLFMPAQAAMAAQAGLDIAAVAAFQHVSGTAMCLFSPVRMALAASIANGSGADRAIYLMLWPYAAGAVLVLQLLSLWTT